jgi:Flp pilus assembly protein TadD
MEEARAELSEAIRLAPDLPEAYGVRGRTWLEGAPSTEALAKAEADLRKAVELAPNGPTQRFHLARALRMTGRNREALPLLKEARALMPKNPDIPFEMARVLETLGASKEAEAARAEFGRLRRNADEGLALEKRCTVAPQDGDVHARAGLFYLGTGEADKAEYYLERAALLQPGNESVNAARKRLASLLGRRA